MKTKILIAAVMFLALSVAGFAQVTAQFGVGSVPVTTVASCGVTERTGDILFTTIAGTGLVQQGQFTINYGVPITSTLAQISLTGTQNNPAVALTTGTAGSVLFLDPNLNTTSSLKSGLLTITITPANFGGPLVNPVQIVVSGVRVDVSGSTLTSLDASISATGNAIAAGQTVVRVINAIAPAIDTVTVTGPIGINASTGVLSSATMPIIKVKEKFVTAFEAPGNQVTNFSNGSIVQLLFTIPAGVTITLPSTATSDQNYGFQLVTVTPNATTGLIGPGDVATATSNTFASTTGTVSAYYRATTPGTNSATTIDTLLVQPTAITVDNTKLPLATTNIAVTAQMAPPSPSTATGTPSTYIPRYAGTQCAVGPTTVVTLSTGNTFLLMTYAVNTLGYDTAMSIANTTKDSLSSTTTPTGAAPQNGTITFTFFPQATAAQITAGTAPASFSYTTSATTTKGTGLTSAGVLNAGNTYTVLLSDLLTLAAQTTTGATAGTFQGYIIATCNFTNAHGQYNIVNFTNGNSIGSVLMLVISSARSGATPENLNN